MYQRGQVTMFVVIGLLVLGVFVGVYFLVSSGVTSSVEGETGGSDALGLSPRVKAYVEGCMREVAVPGLYLLGAQGGVINPTDSTTVLVTEKAVINYAYLNGKTQLSVESVESELNSYMEQNLDSCLNFSTFKKEGYEVELGATVRSDVQIQEDKIVFNINRQIQLSKASEDVTLDSFQVMVPVPFGRYIHDVSLLVEQKNAGVVEFDKLSPLSGFITVIPYDESTVIYSIHEDNVVIEGAPFVFYIAIREDNMNHPPRLDYIAPLVLQKGVLFSGLVLASDVDSERESQDLTFSSDSSEYVVSQDGRLTVMPVQLGEQSFMVRVEDKFGAEDTQEVLVQVIS